MTDHAVAYLRLSQDGKSLERQQRDVEDYADEHGLGLVRTYNEGKRSSGFDDDRPEYQALLEYVDRDHVDAVIVPNLSRLSRDRKERLRLLLDLDAAGVDLHSYELGRAVDLDDDWELVQQSIQATADDVQKRKEIERSKRATAERIANGFDHGRPPRGLQFDGAGEYWVPDDEFETIVEAIQMKESGASFRVVADETGLPLTTVYDAVKRKNTYLRHVDD
ncbi:recombinase family protein [Haloprofundus halobius]|uniref:recombinase family protein n=1 Tax=Haloprofundus halobius TaxID=2876194 RepID=UPI001CC9714F|nr:recombinase family protein [Haloprofundus halobius]